MALPAGIWAALAAALLFGASTPGAKVLVGEIAPVMLAGLLYAGAGIGLAIVIAGRAWWAGASREKLSWFARGDLPWLIGAIATGGVLGPVLLMAGLTSTGAASASLLLNLEGVFTALLAWFLFRENFDRRIALGMLLIVIGGVLLSHDPGLDPGLYFSGWSIGALAIAGACACWALDNNLTRNISANDALLIACIKGLAAASVNISIALFLGESFPDLQSLAASGGLGFLGYGVSLALFVVALRHLGTARTGAYFSAAPFFGASLAVLFLGDALSWQLLTAGLLMGAGVWLHLTERHEHEHEHMPLEHTHVHLHDEHHRHLHDFSWDEGEPHTHAHRHGRLRHKHPHFPDLHHRHDH